MPQRSLSRISPGHFEDGFVLGYGALNKSDIHIAVSRFYEAYLEAKKNLSSSAH